MKITPKHLNQLKIQILAALANNGGQSMVNQYAAADFSTDWLDGSGLPYSRQKAFCFDLFYAADLDADFVASLYDYLNDSHIYTALQAICPAIPDGNGPSISSNPQCTKTIMLGDFDNKTTDYLSDLILEELQEQDIFPSSFAFHIEVEYE